MMSLIILETLSEKKELSIMFFLAMEQFLLVLMKFFCGDYVAIYVKRLSSSVHSFYNFLNDMIN